jgi:hypothetical protein
MRIPTDALFSIDANERHWSWHWSAVIARPTETPRRDEVLVRISAFAVDGEMSRELLKERIADEAKRLGVIPENFYALSHEDIDGFQPLNIKAGQDAMNAHIESIGGVDLIILDNVMCLTAGDQKDEEVWSQTLPWAKSLTSRQIAQIWFHHTGHDETKLYGTKTREWQMDTVILLEEVKRDDTDLSFRLKFKKARQRKPSNRSDFREINLALSEEQ